MDDIKSKLIGPRLARQYQPAIVAGFWLLLCALWLMVNPAWVESYQESQVIAPDSLTAQIIPDQRPVGLPTQLRIPAIGVTVAIEKVGKTASGNVGTPKDITNAGWYSFGPRPGQIGAALVDAHVNNEHLQPGTFAKLHRLKPGDEIFVTDDTGIERRFITLESAKYPYDDFPADKVFGPYDESRLNLITCHGDWLSELQSYNERLIVFARLAAN